MQVEQVAAEGLKREFKVIVPAGEIEQRVRTRLEKLAKTVRLPGFRPGKAPLPLLKKQYGRSILGEVLEEAVDEGSKRTIGDNQLRPALRPKIEVTSFDEGKDLEFELKLEILPEVPAGRARRYQPHPARRRDAAREGRAGDRELRAVAPEVRGPGRAAGGRRRRPGRDRLRGPDRRRAVRGRRRQGLSPAAGLQGHGAGLRGAADRRAAGRDPRSGGDLPRGLRPARDLRQGRRVHRHRERGEGAGAVHHRRGLGEGAGLRGSGRAQGHLRQALHRRIQEHEPGAAQARAARPAGRRLRLLGARGYGRPRVRGDLEAAHRRDGAHRREVRRGRQERGRAQGRVPRDRRAAGAAGPDPLGSGHQERGPGRGRGAAAGGDARGDALPRPGAQGDRVLQEQPRRPRAAAGTPVRGQGLRLHLRAGPAHRPAGLDRGADEGPGRRGGTPRPVAA